MIVYRAKINRPASTRRPATDTRGMDPRVAAQHRKRDSTGLAAEGSHAGGPCPAVCLASLTGWSYGEASTFLAQYGYRRAGLTSTAINRAIAKAIDAPTRRLSISIGATVAQVAREFQRQGATGWIYSSNHVMPVIDGEIQNASKTQLRMKCEEAHAFV